MKLLGQVQDSAEMSNVSEVTSFSIKATAKSFRILSSGLYANKIKAIIRELGCNAYDSHVAAGQGNVPFDVHLPSTLEPWFSVRDYGVGLDHNEVTKIFTTFFESTKTNSNDYVGALGLGSKSPFSYTENFTVTAIKNGVQRIYTAFINDHGVPSIALMTESKTTEPNGVEVKFAVIEQRDFRKFRDEAADVFSWFKTVPNVISDSPFAVTARSYHARDIVPGVHQLTNTGYYGGTSYAVMGHIAYPIEIPDAEKKQRDTGLFDLLNHRLVIEFPIGALDFQPSREGLSYIPATVDAIQAKLVELRNNLAAVLAKEAAEYSNDWAKAQFLASRSSNSLWSEAVYKYINDTKFPLLSTTSWHGRVAYARKQVKLETLAKTYNIRASVFKHSRNEATCYNVRTVRDDINQAECHEFALGSPDYHFVIQDTKTGVVEKAKRYYREDREYLRVVVVLSPADKTKPMEVDKFFAAIHNPPEEVRFLGSTFATPAAAKARNVTILSLQRRGGSRNGYARAEEMVWREADNLDQYDAKKSYYYFNLSGLTVDSKFAGVDPKQVLNAMKTLGLVEYGETIYGVRKADQAEVARLKNWVCLDDFLPVVVGKSSDEQVKTLAAQMAEGRYGRAARADSPWLKHLPDSSIFKKTVAEVGATKSNADDKQINSVRYLSNIFSTNKATTLHARAEKLFNEAVTVLERYGMLWQMSSTYGHNNLIVEYIKMVDAVLEAKQNEQPALKVA